MIEEAEHVGHRPIGRHISQAGTRRHVSNRSVSDSVVYELHHRVEKTAIGSEEIAAVMTGVHHRSEGEREETKAREVITGEGGSYRATGQHGRLGTTTPKGETAAAGAAIAVVAAPRLLAALV